MTAAEQTEEVEEKAPETTAEAAEADAEAAAGSDGENYDTGDASKDNARNQDGIGENELLVVSFGTSYNDSRRLTIGATHRNSSKSNGYMSITVSYPTGTESCPISSFFFLLWP